MFTELAAWKASYRTCMVPKQVKVPARSDQACSSQARNASVLLLLDMQCLPSTESRPAGLHLHKITQHRVLQGGVLSACSSQLLSSHAVRLCTRRGRCCTP